MNLSLLLHFVRQDLLDRYAGSVLGGVWAFIQPLVNILVFVFVFSGIMGARLPGFEGAWVYSVYLISGILGWTAFSATMNRVANVFAERAHVLKKIRISLLVFPLVIILSETIVYAISMGFFAVFLIIVDHEFTLHLLWIPLIYFIQQALAFALGFMFAMLSPFIKDIREFISVLIQLWFWMTPIVYVKTILPDSLQFVLLLNPIFPLVDSYQQSILYGNMPNWLGLGVTASITLVLLIMNYWMYRRLQSDIRDLL